MTLLATLTAMVAATLTAGVALRLKASRPVPVYVKK